MNNVHYLGNPNLKKANVPVDFTQDQVQEYIKCSQDPIHFIKTYMKIVTVDDGLVDFNLWDFQEDMVRKFIDDRFVICKMPRQTGKSTTIIAFLLHYVLYNQAGSNSDEAGWWHFTTGESSNQRQRDGAFFHFKNSPAWFPDYTGGLYETNKVILFEYYVNDENENAQIKNQEQERQDRESEI